MSTMGNREFLLVVCVAIFLGYLALPGRAIIAADGPALEQATPTIDDEDIPPRPRPPKSSAEEGTTTKRVPLVLRSAPGSTRSIAVDR